MPRLTLYHAAPSRSSIALWMLEELGEPYELHVLDMKKGEHRAPAYLAVNRMGKVPALRHGDAVITEAAAICCYLADEFPAAHLNVPVGDPRRGPYLRWLFFGPSCIEPAVTERAFPRKEPAPRSTLGFGDFDTVMDVLVEATAAAKPYLMGDRFTAADVIIGSNLRWGMMFGLIPRRPELAAYVAALEKRPALERATQRDAGLKAEQGSAG
jgi:glutathione S-transferase